MVQNLNHAGSSTAHSPGLEPKYNWEDLRLFLETIQHGSFRSASLKLGLSPATVRRRLAHLESKLGQILLSRHQDGVTLTPEGMKVLKIAERMRDEAVQLDAIAALRESHGFAGPLRVSVTEGIGTFWLIPRLIDFRNRYPDITIDLWCDMKMPDPSTYSADIMVHLNRPDDPELIITRLGYLHLVLFATDEYIKAHGTPKSLADLPNFHFVEQVASQVPSEMLSSLVPNPENKAFITFRVNNSTAHAYAISRSAGIGLLPTYAKAITGRIRPLDSNFHLRRDIWLSYRKSMKELARVRAAILWLKDSFDPVKYPWFAEEFIPPEKLAMEFTDDNVVYLLKGFMERNFVVG